MVPSLNFTTASASFQCPVCYKCFSKKYNMKAHLRLHTGEKPFRCAVAACRKSFKWRSSLASHNRWHSRVAKKRRDCDKPRSISMSSQSSPTDSTDSTNSSNSSNSSNPTNSILPAPMLAEISLPPAPLLDMGVDLDMSCSFDMLPILPIDSLPAWPLDLVLR